MDERMGGKVVIRQYLGVKLPIMKKRGGRIAANVPYSAADRSLADVLERGKTGKVER